MLFFHGGSSSKNNVSVKEVNPADTIYLGDLREKFANDSVFLKMVAPDLMLVDCQHLWAVTESEAVERGLTKEYYKRAKKKITNTNETVKRDVMKGANVKRIPDFQASQENKQRILLDESFHPCKYGNRGVVKCNDIPFFIGVTVRFIPIKREAFAKIHACHDSFVICYSCDI